jgi:ribosomal protein S18 acetylase RimI-like enzyme
VTTRVLPRAEYDRIAHLDVAGFLPYVAGDDVQIVVVEQDERIVGAWSVLRVVHFEGVWIDPAYRGRVGVARRLLTATMRAAQQWSSRFAFTGAATDDVRRLITKHLRGVHIPMDTYAVPISGE